MLSPKGSTSRQAFARFCEDAAENFLRRRGWRIIRRNFHARRGEIDIIARDGRELVFVEVKGKRSLDYGAPQEMLGRIKRERLVHAALSYLETAGRQGGSCRFDLISVMAWPGEGLRFEHLKGAFGLDDVQSLSRGWRGQG